MISPLAPPGRASAWISTSSAGISHRSGSNGSVRGVALGFAFRPETADSFVLLNLNTKAAIGGHSAATQPLWRGDD